MSTLAWQPLTDDDLLDVRQLAQRCLDADGGLPLLAGETMARRLFRSGPGIGGRDETGDLVAAASVFVDGSGQRTATWLVHPSVRNQGHGEALVRWCREHAGGGLLRVVAETTSSDTERVLASFGLQRTFAEHVMRHDLLEVPRVARAAGLSSFPWTDDTADLFHRAYRGAFSTRPGFPDTPRDEWVGEVQGDPGFRPDDSRVVLDERGLVAGFVTLTDDWVDQVGVVPSWRGHALGAHLVVRSLRALRKAGCEQAWLAVNVDNAAHELYTRLGFRDFGLRARYAEVKL
jgi:mycothiol synthase